MTNFWRPLALTAALIVVAGARAAVAQTVIVTNAPAGQNVELTLNAAPLGSVAADEHGDARLPLDLQKQLGKAEIDANVFVDVCEKTYRVLIVERGGQLLAPVPDCERREVLGLYWVRQGTTVVVNVQKTTPTVLLVKGSYDPRQNYTARPPRVAPGGFIVGGGMGLVRYRDIVTAECGNVDGCNGSGTRPGLMGGAEFWLNRFLAAEGGYVRPWNVKVDGKGDGYNFNTALSTHIFTLAGKAGVRAGPTRLYGRAGANYHRATYTSSTTVDDRTITVDGVDQTLAGGTQKFEIKTTGWGWLFGGGMDIWASDSVAIFTDLTFMRLRGKETNGGNQRLNDRLTTFFAGLRVHIGG